MAVINLASKFETKIDERFSQKSITDAHAGHDYEFSGVKEIKIYSIDSVPVTDYTRSGANRFGTPEELGDTVQTMALTQDKSFTFTVDRGNAADQLNIKHAAQRLRTNWDEVCTPLIDKYRIAKWTNGAGLGAIGDDDLTQATVMEAIFNAGAAMNNKLVPTGGRTLFVSQSLYVKVKLSDQIIGIEKLGAKSVANGVVGTLDGMKVVPVPDSYLPDGVEFFVKYKNSTVDPMKFQTFRVHKDPPGLDGDLAECRFYFDSFVLGNKVNGIYVFASGGMTPAPTISISSAGAVTITVASGSTAKYTTDGTDPKTSDTAVTYSASFTVTSGQTVRAYAAKDGSLNSPVSEATMA